MEINQNDLTEQTTQALSAGGIVYKKEGERISVLMIMPSPRESAPREAFRPVWTFPKGGTSDHPGESIEETARREVREEGGVDAKIIADLGEVQYFVRWQDESIYKTVHWFLMQYVSGDESDHDHEVDEAGWFTLSEVETMLTYKTDKEVFEKAKKILK